MNQWDAENGLTTSATSNVPRRRIEPWAARAAELNRQQADRALQQRVLAQLSPQPIPEPPAPADYDPDEAPTAEEDPEAFDIEGWQLNAKITSLMRQRFGINWARHKAHHRLAERALADLKGAGDGKALRNLRNSSGNGSYTAALDAKFGPL